MKTDLWQPHRHDNNETPPDEKLDIWLELPQQKICVWPTYWPTYPRHELPAYTYTTDHGRHGPYRLAGVSLKTIIHTHWTNPFAAVIVISADGFGNRITSQELWADGGKQILLCDESNGRALPRTAGAIRLVVPRETDNALRQIKWVRHPPTSCYLAPTSI